MTFFAVTVHGTFSTPGSTGRVRRRERESSTSCDCEIALDTRSTSSPDPGGAPVQILLSEVEERHAALLGLLQRAAYRQNTPSKPGEARENTDRFLAAVSRHGAVTARVLLPEVKRLLP